MKELNKNKKIAIFITLATIIILFGITYTFFSASVSNANNEKFSTTTATLSLIFDDNDNGVSGTLNLGESVVKKFTIENTGTDDAYGKINWVDLVNTYMDDSLTWKLESSTSENGTYTTIKEGSVPTSSSATTIPLRDGLLVPEGDTIYYKLTITLNNLDVDQSSDISASMHSKFNLVAGNPVYTAVEYIQNIVAGANQNSTDTITKQAPAGAECTNTFVYDGTTDNNLRYVGESPCNYLEVNGLLFRIVGVMNNIEGNGGDVQTRLKILSVDSNGGDFPYGRDPNTNAISNRFETSHVSNYLDSMFGWISLRDLKCLDSNLISNAKHYLRGISTNETSVLAKNLYTIERTTGNVNTGNSTTAMSIYSPLYPSDIALAVGDNRAGCLNKNMIGDWQSRSPYMSDCTQYNWLLDESNYIFGWTIMPASNNSTHALIFDSNGMQASDSGWGAYYPTVYLNSNVEFSSGTGDINDPYIIGENKNCSGWGVNNPFD